MRILSLFLVILFLSSAPTEVIAQWEQVGWQGGEISIKAQLGKILVGQAGNNIYRSTDWGTSWTLFNTGLPRSSYTFDCTIKSSNIHFYLFSQDLPASLGNTGLFIAKENDTEWTYVPLSFIDGRRPFAQSYNGGAGWELPIIFPDNKILTFYPGVSASTTMDTNAGIYLSSDVGISWIRLNDPITGNVRHLSKAKFFYQHTRLYLLCWSYDPNLGQIEKLFASNDAGKTWEKLAMPNGDSVTQEPIFLNDNILYLKNKNHLSSTNHISTDGGKTWRANAGPLPDIIPDWEINTIFENHGRLYCFVSFKKPNVHSAQFISSDNGVTWKDVTYPDSTHLYNILGDDSLYIINKSFRSDSSLKKFEPIHYTKGIFYGSGALKYVSGSMLIAAGRRADTIIVSNDNGATWTSKLFLDSFWVDPTPWVKDGQTLFACGKSKNGYKTYLFKSYTDGQTWDTLPQLTGIRQILQIIPSGDTIFIVTSAADNVDSLIFYSLNGGHDWSILPLPSNQYPYAYKSGVDIKLENESVYLFPLYDDPEFASVSNNLGSFWEEKEIPYNSNQYSYVDFAKQGKNFLITDRGSVIDGNNNDLINKSHLYLSQDSLNSFKLITDGIGDSTILQSFSLVDGILYASAGARSRLDPSSFPQCVRGQCRAYFSLDTGLTWRQLPGNVLGDPYLFVGSDFYFMSGEELWRLPKSALSSVHSEKPPVAPSTSFVSCYPNPAVTQTTISYSIPSRSSIRLTASDITGRQVAILADEVEDGGIHSVEWNTSLLPSGSYILTLSACGQTASKVILVTK
jgi:photosystem II stability/assembly factor-like uncharacterized protein